MEVGCFPGFELLSANVAWRCKDSAPYGILFFARGGFPHGAVCCFLPGAGFRTNALQRFGYLWLTAEEDSLLFRKGERIPAHEFHYWDCTENGSDLLAEKPNGKTWRCGFVGKTLYAAFPHLHLGGELPLSRRFAEACVKYADA